MSSVSPPRQIPPRIAPPRIARWFLQLAIPKRTRDDVAYDMDELYARRVQRRGGTRARMWYVAQALSFFFRFTWSRMRPEKNRMLKSGISWLDCKLGVRMLIKYPGLSIIGGFAMAAAIALGAGTFEYIRMQVHPKIPLKDGDRIVQLANWDTETGSEDNRAQYDFDIWRRSLKTVENLGAYRAFERNLIAPNVPLVTVRVAEITANAFPLTGVQPVLGRTLQEADEQKGALPVAVIGYDVWQNEFQGDRSVIGKTVQLGSTNATIIGVMPDGFGFPINQQMWMPLHLEAAQPRTGSSIRIFGRLAKGVDVEKAQLELATLGKSIAASNPSTHAHLLPEVRAYASARTSGNQLAMVVILYVGTLLILLAACANVATLIFARTAMRESEIVVRNALGATRGRVMMQLFVESLVLALAAAAVGLTAVHFVRSFIWHQAVVVRHEAQPFWNRPGIEPSTILYTALLAFAGAVLVGLLPAIKATNARVQERLRHISAGGTSMQFGGVWSVIIVVQVALTVLCLPIGIGGTLETMRDQRIRSEFPAAQYLTMRMEVDRDEPVTGQLEDTNAADAQYHARVARVYEELKRRLMNEPGVDVVTYGNTLPGMDLPYPIRRFEVQPEKGAAFLVNSNLDGYGNYTTVAPGYFESFHQGMIAGRSFNAGDVGASANQTNVVVVNESLARNIGSGALGARIRIAGNKETKPGQWYTIIGVVKNFGMDPTDRGDADFMFIPASPADVNPAMIAVHATHDVPGLAARVNQIALTIDPGLRVYDVVKLGELIRRRDMPTIMTLIAVCIMITLAVILSAAGLFALMSVGVARRTREIGIRMALGASAFGVLKAMFARSAAQVGTGILIGNLLIFGLASLLTGRVNTDVALPMLGVSVLMALVGMAACAVPAWRALRVQPTQAFKGVG